MNTQTHKKHDLMLVDVDNDFEYPYSKYLPLKH